jgi:hypothetical protein
MKTQLSISVKSIIALWLAPLAHCRSAFTF